MPLFSTADAVRRAAAAGRPSRGASRRWCASRAGRRPARSAARCGNLGVPVRVPVVRDGEVRYVLSAVVRPEAILRVVNEQRMPGDWIVSVFDAEQRPCRALARARALPRHAAFADAAGADGIDSAAGNEVVGRRRRSRATPCTPPLARVRSTRWVVALGVPAAVEASALRDSALAYGGGILLSLGIGSIAAWLRLGQRSRRRSRACATPRWRSAAARRSRRARPT